MLEFFIGIAIGATFADFWRYLYQVTRSRLKKWMNQESRRHDTSV